MSNSARTNRSNIQKMVTLAILVGIVIVFQYLGSFIHIGPTSISLVLIPIVVGAMLLGPMYGAFLGLVFGAMTLWAGISGIDVFTNTLFVNQPVATTAICIGKAVLAGWGSGMIYKLFVNKDRIVASFLAAAAAPIINTGIFVLGGLTLVSGTLNANFVSGTTLIYFLVIGCAGWNFVGEFAINILLAPAINTIVSVVEKSRK